MKKSNITRSDLTFLERITAPTPSFFKKVRTIGLVMGVIGAALLASPVALPAVVGTIGGYLVLGGSIITSVAQTAVKDE
ncbi:MAG: hypothetical protein HXX14_14430 [Bacteroidetes bacterium]|nr:hypothetical protein [Bacteroidota bacterium]NWJ51297.1 hypothetical protein [Bacteroidota bacterium]NWJ52051.1 hypothetical protein [Bacteroidota bacterium]